MKYILYLLAKYQDKYQVAPDRIEKLNISDKFFNEELPAILMEIEKECGYHASSKLRPLPGANEGRPLTETLPG